MRKLAAPTSTPHPLALGRLRANSPNSTERRYAVRPVANPKAIAPRRIWAAPAYDPTNNVRANGSNRSYHVGNSLGSAALTALIGGTMPKFNVYLYTPWRLKFARIEAADPVAAVRAALDLPEDEAVEMESAEGLATDALVDEIDDEGENVEDSDGKNFDILWGRPESPVITPMPNNAYADRMYRLGDRELAAVLAGLRLLQQHRGRNDYPAELCAIEEAGGSYMSDAEIDDLCARLNIGGN